jgi:hypothetical protein
MDNRMLRLAMSLGIVIALAACQSLPHHRVNYRAVAAPSTLLATPVEVVALPLSVKVKEMSAGGLKDEVGDWTREAKDHIRAALKSGEAFDGKIELVELGDLAEEEKGIVEEHIALFDVVAGGALAQTMVPPVAEAWQPKAKHFDYTLGPGLAFLRDRTGADKALILFGEDVISTSGRKAVSVIAAAFGVGVPLGHSFLIAGVVDLQDGDILWMDYALSMSAKTFRKREDVDALLTELFTNYPGIETYLEGIGRK